MFYTAEHCHAFPSDEWKQQRAIAKMLKDQKKQQQQQQQHQQQQVAALNNGSSSSSSSSTSGCQCPHKNDPNMLK